ncbi:xanthine dehydrogenase family protein molybdopterin-binding subunit [Vineibacter terrae]|uniref:Xanthine dehydrogenase family protein molybdopterin-binding subunit n=2 Tax=Vineibacter terrae TaxID=2586908 RepID=A0A5C8PAB0_9HYPH|nr:xanthine dehydrogenase family protein molybdopterin-binding subunit [Vineibacter terrae]
MSGAGAPRPDHRTCRKAAFMPVRSPLSPRGRDCRLGACFPANGGLAREGRDIPYPRRPGMPDTAPVGLGAPVKRLEDARLLTGQGRFTDNLAARDALHVYFLRSPHAHARLARIDTQAATAAPGVAAVLTGADAAGEVGHLPAISEIKGLDGLRHREPLRPSLACGRVRYAGEIVAMVVARSLAQARDAAELIAVDYEALPAVVAGDDALAPGAPLLHDDVPGNLMCAWGKGDADAVDRAFAGAARVVSLSQRFNRILANYLEPRAIGATHDAASDVTTVTFASQSAHIPHKLLCDRVLKRPRDKLRLVTPDVGGGFGPKFTLYPEVTPEGIEQVVVIAGIC